ncbi:MAG: ABC transporter substrate-binding protein, partial [Pseudomonadota bacterium]
DPPAAAQFNISRQFEDLIEADLLLDLTEIADEQGWRDFIRPSSILEVCERDGRIYCVPVNIHSWQWAWASIPVFEQSGVPLPKNIDEFLESAPKIQEAGFIPFAIGGETWQHSGAFAVLLLNTLGADTYLQLYRDKNPDVARSDEMASVFEKFRALKAFTDPGSTNRNWNDTTNLVITDQAAIQIMGDWARGEFAVAGEEPGVDYECIAGPSENPYLTTGGDVFLFPKQGDADVEAAQLSLAGMMVNPRVQALFNNAKGSLPVREDVDMSLADACMQKGLEILSNPETVVGDVNIFVTADTDGQIRDLFAEFWSDDGMSIADGQERLAQIIEAAE